MTSVVDRNSLNRVQVGWWGWGLVAEAGAGECVFLAVTSLLVLLLLSFLGRTGLLADLLPSFAVEIMPGIQSFHPSVTQSSVILSVYPSATSLCGVRFTLTRVLSGDKKSPLLTAEVYWVEISESWWWDLVGEWPYWDVCRHRETVDVMSGSIWEQKWQHCSREVLYQGLCSLPASTKVTPLQPVRPRQPCVPIWLYTLAALLKT